MTRSDQKDGALELRVGGLADEKLLCSAREHPSRGCQHERNAARSDAVEHWHVVEVGGEDAGESDERVCARSDAAARRLKSATGETPSFPSEIIPCQRSRKMSAEGDGSGPYPTQETKP